MSDAARAKDGAATARTDKAMTKGFTMICADAQSFGTKGNPPHKEL